MRKSVLGVIALVLSSGVNADLLVLETQRHHIGDDPTLHEWVPGEGLSYTITFELSKSAISDGILRYETYDVDSGFNSVIDTIDLDGIQIAILDSTTPEPGYSGSNPFVFHPMEDLIPASLLTAGSHELIFTSGPDFNSEYDDYMFQNVTLEFSPVPIPAALWLFGSGLLGLIGVARRRANA